MLSPQFLELDRGQVAERALNVTVAAVLVRPLFDTPHRASELNHVLVLLTSSWSVALSILGRDRGQRWLVGRLRVPRYRLDLPVLGLVVIEWEINQRGRPPLSTGTGLEV